jgi:hypothetical protein
MAVTQRRVKSASGLDLLLGPEFTDEAISVVAVTSLAHYKNKQKHAPSDVIQVL